MSVGAIERRFFGQLVIGRGLADAGLPDQYDKDQWPALRAALTATFARRTQTKWTAVFADLDACVAPVLSAIDATTSPHPLHHKAFVEVDGLLEPAPAPRFSRAPAGVPKGESAHIENVDLALRTCGQ